MTNSMENIPAVFDTPHLLPAAPGVASVDQESSSTPFSHYLWIVRRQAWKIVSFVALSLILTTLISSRLKPIYESTVSVNIDRQAPSGVVGSDAEKKANSSQDADQYIATQMKIMQSDTVMRPIANKFNLLEIEHQFVGLDDGEKRALKNGPIRLKNLKVSRPAQTYLVHIAYRSQSPQLSADVANAIAKSYVENIYKLQIDSSLSAAGFMERQLDELRAKMERSGHALAAFEKDLSLVNPEQKTDITAARLLQLNNEYTAAQTDRVRKEALVRAMDVGSLAAEQISGQADDLKFIAQRLNEAEEKLASIKTSKGPNHPDYKRAESELNAIAAQYETTRTQIKNRIQADFHQAASRETMLEAAVKSTKAEYDQLGSKHIGYEQLKREADADRTLYEELVRKIREASINAGFQNRNTVISDAARPPLEPIFPNLKLNLVLAGLLSSIIGIGFVILIDSLNTSVRDPEEVPRLFQVDLIGTLPLMRNPAVLTAPAAISSSIEGSSEVAVTSSLNAFGEAVRMVRNSILLGNFDRRMRSILFTSAVPGEGKSTAALHFAIANAEQGKKTLLIDADLRRPTLHKKMNLQMTVGLSDVLGGEVSWHAAIEKHLAINCLEFLAAGSPSKRTADLIGSGMADLLDQVTMNYDLVVVDGPPLLGFAEPMQLAIASDGVVVVAVAGETNRRAISSVVNTLKRLRANIIGIVLNRTSKESGNGYYYYYNYDQQYSRYSKQPVS